MGRRGLVEILLEVWHGRFVAYTAVTLHPGGIVLHATCNGAQLPSRSLQADAARKWQMVAGDGKQAT